MPKYPFVCGQGHQETHTLTFAELEMNSRVIVCSCGEQAERDWQAQFQSQWLPPKLPRNLWTSWYSVHDRSPREMARDKNVERYDPSLPHKPAYKPPTDEQLKSLIRSIPDHEFERVQRTQIDTSEEAVKQPVAS